MTQKYSVQEKVPQAPKTTVKEEQQVQQLQPQLKWQDKQQPSSEKQIGIKDNASKDWTQLNCVNDKCIQIIAWALLTLGLCIIVSTFYFSLLQRKHFDDDYDDINFIDDYADRLHNVNTLAVSLDFIPAQRLSKDTRLDAIHFVGCNELSCKVACSQVDNIYDAVANISKLSNCSAIEMLILKQQSFPDNIIHNQWHKLDQAVYELVMVENNITRIKSGAFNCLFFSATFHIHFEQTSALELGGGALLGLRALRYLVIIAPLNELDRAFFQPVQTTLRRFRLNAGLIVASGTNIFGISYLNQLEYADISFNVFEGPITRNMFLSTPNLKYLHMSYAKITSIDSDAFGDLGGTLQVLDLTHNLLTTISYDTVESLLAVNSRTFVYLDANNWHCDCDLYGFVQTYRKHIGQFMNFLFCRAPHHLYGISFNEVDFEKEGCDTRTVSTEESPINMTTASSTPLSITNNGGGGGEGYVVTGFPANGDKDTPTIGNDSVTAELVEASVFKMRCLNTVVVSTDEDSSADVGGVRVSTHFMTIEETDPTVSVTAETTPSYTPQLLRNEARSKLQMERQSVEVYELVKPSYDFELTLLPNKSVKAVIHAADPITKNIKLIWFSKYEEKDIGAGATPPQKTYIPFAGENIDFNCEKYTAPFMIVNDLIENTTYTFCLLPNGALSISPFDCLPMHVNATLKPTDNVWITNDSKPFTVGMMSAILLLSIFFGAIVAYFGIKSHPELLEGSKNVLVVKKSESACYVSTISETDYLQSSSIMKKPLKTHGSNTLMETPPIMAPPPPPMLSVTAYDKHLERLPSTKSTSTLFEDAFVPPRLYDDQYEQPKDFSSKRTTYTIEEHLNNLNSYAMSPCSPPPLPKRNPSIT